MPIRGGTSLSMTAKTTRLHHRNLPLLLLQARERVISHFRPILNANGVTEQQWRIVRVLYEKPSLEPREIVELCRISSPSMAGVLARMEELGLVARQRLKHDQRRVRVSLTRRARSMAARMAPQIDATYRRIERQIGEEFSERFQRHSISCSRRWKRTSRTGGRPGSIVIPETKTMRRCGAVP